MILERVCEHANYFTDHFPGCQSYCQIPVTSSLTLGPSAATIYAWQTRFVSLLQVMDRNGQQVTEGRSTQYN